MPPQQKRVNLRRHHIDAIFSGRLHVYSRNNGFTQCIAPVKNLGLGGGDGGQDGIVRIAHPRTAFGRQHADNRKGNTPATHTGNGHFDFLAKRVKTAE